MIQEIPQDTPPQINKKKIICWADTPCYPDQANY